MAQISLTVHGRSYEVTCDDGQESHLLKLAAHIDRKMSELEGSVGHIAEQRLLFMTCLLIADELYDTQRQVDGLKAGRGGEAGAGARGGAAGSGDEQASRALEACAQRIEAIAARIEGA